MKKKTIKKRKVIEEKIVVSFFSDLKTLPWYSFLFYKPRWWFEGFSFWLKNSWQKLIKGYADSEAYNFNYWHSKTVVSRLKHLRNNHAGCPNIDFESKKSSSSFNSHSLSIRSDSKKSKERFNNQSKKWGEILDKIIWSFENFDEPPDPIKPKDYDNHMIMKRYDDGSVSYENVDKRKSNYKPIRDHEKRVQEGLKLFAKHYASLWD